MRQVQGNGAVIVGDYRYQLWRTWDEELPRLLWVLLNPSTADAVEADQTLRRCMSFSRAWGYGGLEIVNLFALRAPSPQKLKEAKDPIGPENDRYIADAVTGAADIVAGWGERGSYQARDRAVCALLARSSDRSLCCLGTVRNGCPLHPLYVEGSTRPRPYRAPYDTEIR